MSDRPYSTKVFQASGEWGSERAVEGAVEHVVDGAVNYLNSLFVHKIMNKFIYYIQRPGLQPVL